MESSKLLGKEKVSKLLFKFALPCVISLLIGALYNMVDQIFIGNSSLGYLGNAATGVSFPIICICNAFAWCIGDGAASYLSILAGREDTESAHKCIGVGLISTLVISIILSIISLIFTRPLMDLFGASKDTLDLATSYFRILSIFFPFYLLSSVMNSMIRADGSPTYAMLAVLSGAILNLILDPIFIFILDWGIEGAAIATVIGQVISFVFCAVYFFKPKSFKLNLSSFKFDFKMLKSLVILGGSTFVIQISLVIMTLLSNILLREFGALSIYGSDIPLSVFSIQTKVYTIVSNIAVGIALGGQPILGYNYGANRMDRVKETYKIIISSSLLIGVIATLIFLIYPEGIIVIFGAQNDLYMDFAVKSFRIFLSLGFVTCFIKVSSIFFQAIGKPVEALITSIIRDMFCFVIFALSFSFGFEALEEGKGIFGILFASPASDLIAGSIVLILTIMFFKKLKVTNKEEVTVKNIETSRPGYIICISRAHGTQGKQIGEAVAKALNVPFYSKELTAIIAHESGLSKEFINDDFDDNKERYKELYLSTQVHQQAMIAQEMVLKKIANEGSCVIIGRAAGYVLRHYPNVIKIYLTAPIEYRINNVMMMYGDNQNEAKEHIKISDESRANYYQNISGEKWNDIKNYNLYIDVSVGKESVTKIILDYIDSLNKKSLKQ